ncbi:MAG TPA: hypothetical protein VGO59_00970 [Verrucomicrobiae bacterium]|jgi:hypothetical protein
MKPSQKKSLLLSPAVCLLSFLAGTAPVQAQLVTNTFTNPGLDFVNTGIIGSGFTGVDLNAGDIPGGSGSGNTLVADTGASLGVPGSGFLFVENPVGGFAGAEDDGFFCFNVVWGDFDAYVDVTQPYANTAFTFSGLLARGISSGNGGPFNPTGTNASENWLNITRFDEFGTPMQVRYATNAADNQITVTNLLGATNITTVDIFLRLNRTGDTFSFYDSTTPGGPWTLERTLTRADLHGAAMQVGIEEGSFAGGTTPTETFTDFGIKGTNVVTPPANDPANVVFTNPNQNGTVEISWNPAAGSDGSIVVMTRNAIMTQEPYYGFTYAANTNFGSVANMGGHEQVIYAGSGTNVTVGGLLTPQDNYTVAVYSYTTNGGNTPITYDSNPAIGNVAGPGVVIGISASITPANIPVNGVATVDVVANFSSGGTEDVTAATSISSSDNAISAAAASGALVLSATNVTAGSVGGNITVSYSGFSTNINAISHAPAFTDNFNVPHSYLTNGVVGTGWDGVYEMKSDIAGVVGPNLSMSAFDADITTNNCLTISSANGQWKGADDNGPYLYKVVPGDFETSVHITGFNHVAYNFVGIMARAFATSNNASAFGAGQSEDNVNWQRFDQFGDTTVLFNTINGNTTEFDDKDGESTDFWLLMTRVNATNFNLFKSPTFGGPWTLVHTVVQPALVAGTMVQVGLQQATYNGTIGVVQFDTFMLDGNNIVGTGTTPAPVPTAATGVTATLTAGDSQAVITWTNGVIPPSGVPTAFVVMRAGSPVSSQPYFGDLTTANSAFGAGTDLGAGNFVVFRGTGNTVTVTGLIPGIQYYVAVYEYEGSSATKAFNEAGGDATGTPPVVFTGIAAVVQNALIPANGIGGSYQVLASVQGVTNLIDVSASATIVSNGIVAGADGFFTGITPGTANNVVFSFTPGNSTNALLSAPSIITVRSPTYSDNFSVSNNYLATAQAANGNPAIAVAGTIWDGVFLGGGTLAPAGYAVPFGTDGMGQTTALDANITASNTLSLVHQNDTWDGTGPDDGFFLFKNVVGDFQASVFISSMDQSNYQMSGIMARLANRDGSAAAGPGSENFINQTEFEEFGFLDILRYDINGADVNFGTPPSVIPANNGFLMVRTHGTNFTFYRRSSPTGPFTGPIASYTENLGLFASGTSNVVEVGPSSATYALPNSGLLRTAFSSFMLDLRSGPVLNVAVAGGSLTISWDADSAFQHLYSTTDLAAQFTLMSGVGITTANGTSSVTLPIGSGNQYFKVGP